MKKINLLFAFLIAATSILAQSKSLTGKEFAAMRKANKNIIVVDARKATDYSQRHLMKAVNIPYGELNKDGEIKGMIKDVASLADYLGKKGINTESTVVIYDDGSSKYNSRVYWVLKYLGVKDVHLLHKDMTQWKIARLPLTASVVPAKKQTFAPKVNNAIFVKMTAVQAASKNKSATIIDVRDASEYDGSAENSKGHIPGAINIPYKEVLNANGFFKTKAELEALAAKYKLDASKETFVYCITSVRAAVVFFAFKNILGFENVKVFDGAYNEWVSNPNNPID